MNIQYLGFEQDLKHRIYGFRVIETLKEDREFRLSVETQALAASKFKFQDVPDLCFSTLKLYLESETSEQAVPRRIRVGEEELKRYLQDHYPSKSKRS